MSFVQTTTRLNYTDGWTLNCFMFQAAGWWEWSGHNNRDTSVCGATWFSLNVSELLTWLQAVRMLHKNSVRTVGENQVYSRQNWSHKQSDVHSEDRVSSPQSGTKSVCPESWVSRVCRCFYSEKSGVLQFSLDSETVWCGTVKPAGVRRPAAVPAGPDVSSPRPLVTLRDL